MSSDLVAIENRLWAAADQLWANTGLKPAEFSTPVLGLIFLRYADKRFSELTKALAAQGTPADEIDAVDYQAEGVLYLPEQARFSHLLTLTEGAGANGSGYDCTEPLRRGGRTARDFVLGEDGLNVLVGCRAGGPTTLAIAASSFGRWSKTRL